MKTIVQWLSLVGGVVRRHGRNDVLKNLLDAAVATGQTLEDIVDAALVQPTQEVRRRRYWLP